MLLLSPHAQQIRPKYIEEYILTPLYDNSIIAKKIEVSLDRDNCVLSKLDFLRIIIVS